MPTQHTGTITTWKDDKGFGFITPDQGAQQVFFHISDLLPHQIRPGIQMKVRFSLGYDQQKRLRATQIRLTQSPSTLPTAQARSKLLVLPFVTASTFLLLLLLGSYLLQIPLWVPFIYIAVSLLTFFFYAVDKSNAIYGTRRIPEATLHMLELLGGWPGALVAQSYYRHKTSKTSFQMGYLVMVMANLVVLMIYIFGYHLR